MCCCNVVQCCCGCTSHATGVVIWALIDAIFNIIYVVAPIAAGIANFGPHLWGVLILLADLLLAYGAYASNTCLMLFWQIVMMIQIVMLFILWIAMPILVVGVIAASSAVNEINNGCAGEPECQTANTYLGAGIGAMIAALIVIIVLPLIYIYFWIVVNSLRKQITQSRQGAVLPVQNMVWSQPQPIIMQPYPHKEEGYNNPGYVGEPYI